MGNLESDNKMVKKNSRLRIYQCNAYSAAKSILDREARFASLKRICETLEIAIESDLNESNKFSRSQARAMMKIDQKIKKLEKKLTRHYLNDKLGRGNHDIDDLVFDFIEF